MPATPLISAVTVHRNDLKGLRKTCDSLDLQSFDNWEHLIIDGASTDGTVAWLEQNAHLAPNRTFISKADRGIFDAMNRGIELAQGDIVVFVNAGDQLPDPETLTFVAHSWLEEGWKWAVGAIQYVTPSGELLHRYNASPIDRRKMELGRNFIPHPAAYFQLAFVREVGPLRLDLSVAADQEHMLRCLELCRPTEWQRTMSLFESDGASAQISEWQTQRLLHQIRLSHDCLLWDSRIADSLYGQTLAAYRYFRRVAQRG